MINKKKILIERIKVNFIEKYGNELSDDMLEILSRFQYQCWIEKSCLRLNLKQFNNNNNIFLPDNPFITSVINSQGYILFIDRTIPENIKKEIVIGQNIYNWMLKADIKKVKRSLTLSKNKNYLEFSFRMMLMNGKLCNMKTICKALFQDKELFYLNYTLPYHHNSCFVKHKNILDDMLFLYVEIEKIKDNFIIIDYNKSFCHFHKLTSKILGENLFELQPTKFKKRLLLTIQKLNKQNQFDSFLIEYLNDKIIRWKIKAYFNKKNEICNIKIIGEII